MEVERGGRGPAEGVRPPDWWDKRFTSPAPWDHADISTYHGLRFAAEITTKARDSAKGRAGIPERQYYAPLRKTYLVDPALNPGLMAVGLDGQHRDYDKDDYYAWRHKGLRWSKTMRFPKSRWTKDWDHNNDKKLTHRPVAKFYDTEGLGKKETIQRWVEQTSVGFFSGRDRSRLLGESTTCATADLGPGEYAGTSFDNNDWAPKGVYCGVVKPSACFESQSKRDLFANNGYGPSPGPRNPPRPLFVSSEDERIQVQRRLLQSRAASAMGKPAPEDWSRTDRGFSFGHDCRVTTAEESSLQATNNCKRYVRISLDNKSRMEAIAYGAHHVPAAIIVSSGITTTPPPADDEVQEQEEALCPENERYAATDPRGEQQHHHQQQNEAQPQQQQQQQQQQQAVVANKRVTTRAKSSRAATAYTAGSRRSTAATTTSGGSTTTRRRANSASSTSASSSRGAVPISWSSAGKRRPPTCLIGPVRGGAPPSSTGARSLAAIDLLKQAKLEEATHIVVDTTPALLVAATTMGSSHGRVHGGTPSLELLGGPVTANRSYMSGSTTSSGSNSFLSTALHKALAHRKVERVDIHALKAKPQHRASTTTSTTGGPKPHEPQEVPQLQPQQQPPPPAPKSSDSSLVVDLSHASHGRPRHAEDMSNAASTTTSLLGADA